MPELPEVETTRRGLEPHLVGATVADVVIRHPQLRWPVPPDLPRLLRGRTIVSLHRRAKYLLIGTDAGTLILHLGMSGSLRVLPLATPRIAHDHFDIELDSGQTLRFNDPIRRGIHCSRSSRPSRSRRNSMVNTCGRSRGAAKWRSSSSS